MFTCAVPLTRRVIVLNVADTVERVSNLLRTRFSPFLSLPSPFMCKHQPISRFYICRKVSPVYPRSPNIEKSTTSSPVRRGRGKYVLCTPCQESTKNKSIIYSAFSSPHVPDPRSDPAWYPSEPQKKTRRNISRTIVLMLFLFRVTRVPTSLPLDDSRSGATVSHFIVFRTTATQATLCLSQVRTRGYAMCLNDAHGVPRESLD